MLYSVAHDPEERARRARLPYCLYCGNVSPHLIDESKCEDFQQDPHVLQQIVTTAKLSRADAYSARMHSSQKLSTTYPLNLSPKKERTILVNASFYVGGKQSMRLGNISRPFPARTFLSDITKEFAAFWNVAWAPGTKEMELIGADLSLRWHNNLLPHLGSASGTLAHFYDTHRQLLNSSVFLDVSGVKRTKAQSVNLRFLLDICQFEARTGANATDLF
ncbi:hypothetical protein ONZ45_g6256 [Pleurotus djamor]|nr:hypothetical protein ONZ45_g6256 [Pleurotus djamor]